MITRRKLKRAVQRGTREFVTGAIQAVGFGVGVASGVANAMAERVSDPLKIRERVHQIGLEQMANQFEKVPSSLKGEYLATAMVYSAARKAKKEVKAVGVHNDYANAVSRGEQPGHVFLCAPEHGCDGECCVVCGVVKEDAGKPCQPGR